MYMSSAKMFCTSSYMVKREERYKTSISSNPADLWYWRLYVCNADSNTDSYLLDVQIKVTYYALFTRYGAVTPS